jgi:hypothetical protein
VRIREEMSGETSIPETKRGKAGTKTGRGGTTIGEEERRRRDEGRRRTSTSATAEALGMNEFDQTSHLI